MPNRSVIVPSKYGLATTSTASRSFYLIANTDHSPNSGLQKLLIAAHRVLFPTAPTQRLSQNGSRARDFVSVIAAVVRRPDVAADGSW